MSHSPSTITFIITGGTIDGKYDPSTECKVTKEESGIANYIDNVITPHFSTQFDKIMMIDSLAMTDEHRKIIVETINSTKSEKIIITHGTSAIVETANFIKTSIPDIQKTIILVGAMIPLEGFYPTDASFNLGYAIAQTQTRTHGVYVCMNANCFEPEDVIKNVEKGRFEFKDAS